MGKYKVNDLFLYRHRYVIGYIGLALLFLVLLLFAVLYVPGGLNSSEISAVVKGASLDLQNPASFAVVSLPYTLLQQASIEVFGMNNFAIKLPSLILAFITGVGAVLLLRRWFKSNVAVLATLIMITTGQFLFVAQMGAASITYMMWSVWLLLAASMVTGGVKHKTFWVTLLFVTIGLSLYTPLSIYLLFAIVSAALLHPHVRHTLKRLPSYHYVLFFVIIGLFAAPLGYLVYLRPELGLELLGAPANWPPDLLANARQIAEQYLLFFKPAGEGLMTPVFGLGSIILMGIGAWQLFKARYTARSYAVTAWFVLLIPVILINPTFTTITFVPFLLLLANGLNYLLRSWYRLFPRNPYARIAGLMPLVVLVGGMLVSGVDRFVYGYHYAPETVRSFTRDLTLFNYQVRQKEGTVLLVSTNEKPFYDAVAEHTKNMTVVTSTPATGNFAATHDAQPLVSGATATKIVVTSHSIDADRFYIYKK